MSKQGIVKVITVLTIFMISFAFAELKLGYVNSNQIMQEWDKAAQAQQKLDKKAQQIRADFQNMQQKLDSMSQAFEKQRMMMSEQRRKQKQQEIMNYRKKIQQYRTNQLGPQGKIQKFRQNLTKPILDKINQVIQSYGQENNYDYIFDSVKGNILYAEQAHDITDKILYRLRRNE